MRCAHQRRCQLVTGSNMRARVVGPTAEPPCRSVASPFFIDCRQLAARLLTVLEFVVCLTP